MKSHKPEYAQFIGCAVRKGENLKTRAHVVVSGLVQGVFFRLRMKQRADSLRVKGWVRNLPDGKVVAVFEGEENAVKALVEYCRHGPGGAVVTNVELTWGDYAGEFREFEIK